MRVALGMLAVAAVAAGALYLSSADVRYRHAELLYQKGDFEKALLLCEKALQRNPGHAPTRALYTEIQFILGVGKATPNNGEYDRFMRGSWISPAILRKDIDHLLVQADHRRLAGNTESAAFDVRKALEFLRWMPEDERAQALRHEAEVLKLRLAADGSPDD